MILISSVERLESETVSRSVSGRSVRSYIKVQIVMLNLGKSDYCQICAEYDRCTDGAELRWLVVGEGKKCWNQLSAACVSWTEFLRFPRTGPPVLCGMNAG